jgi:hypothetical protein
MTEGSCANVTVAKMHSAEMTTTEMLATTEVATSTVAAATACKGVGRETQPVKGDARQQQSCYVGPS